MRIASILFLFSLASCSFNSAEYEVKKLEVDPEFAIPLAYGKLTIQDILNQTDSSYIHQYPDGLIYLSYQQELASQDIRELVDIPNLSLQRTLTVPGGNYPPNANDVNSTTSITTIDMGISPEKLTEISFKSGQFNYTLNLNPVNSNVSFAIKIRILEYVSKSTGQALQQIVTTGGAISLSDYTFISNNPNKFTLELTLIIKAHNNAFNVASGSAINLNFNYSGVDFNYIKGFLGDQIANPPSQSLDIGTFGGFLEDNHVIFAQPKISLDVINDYGVPLQVTFINFSAEKNFTSLPISLSPSSPITINQPASLGQSATTSVTVTNVNQIFNFGPSHFLYTVSGHINNGLTSGNNFLADTSKMRVRMNVELPMYGKASDILLADTSDVDLGDLKQSSIDSAQLLVKFTNQMPLDANLQIYLIDDLGASTALLDAAQTNMVKGPVQRQPE